MRSVPYLHQVRRLVARELEVWVLVAEGDPRVFEYLFSRVSLVRVHVQHMRQQILHTTPAPD